MNCPKCKNEISEWRSTCPVCGSPVETAEGINEYGSKVWTIRDQLDRQYWNLQKMYMGAFLILVLGLWFGNADGDRPERLIYYFLVWGGGIGCLGIFFYQWLYFVCPRCNGSLMLVLRGFYYFRKIPSNFNFCPFCKASFGEEFRGKN